MDVPSYQNGYADAKAGKPSQCPVVPAPTPVPPADPPVRLILQTEDIDTVINSVPYVGVLRKFALVPNGSYKTSGAFQPKDGNFDLDGQGASVVFTEPASATSVVKLASSNSTIRNTKVSVAVAGNDVMFRIVAPLCSIINCTLIGPVIATFVLVDVGGIHALVQGNTTPLTNSVSFYTCEDWTQILSNTIAGSIGETSVRVSSPSGTTRLPIGIIIKGNTISTSGKNAKGGMEWRMAGVGSQFVNNTMHSATVRVGQDGMTAVDQSIAGLLVAGNVWDGPPCPGSPQCLMLKNGIVTAITNVYPPTDAVMHYALSVSGPLTLTVDEPGLYNKTTKPGNVTVNGG